MAQTFPAKTSDPSDFKAQRAAFRRLHESGCFVIPNPWDIGTARYLRHRGFKALATTSGGFAFVQGFPDGQEVTRDMVLRHIAEIVSVVNLPINADFESAMRTNLKECLQM